MIEIVNLIVEDRIWTLLARQCAGEATAAEMQELEQLLAQDPVLRNTAQKTVAAWHEQGNNNMQKALTAFAKIDARIQQQAPPRIPFYKKYPTLLTAAAACIVVLAGTWMLFFRKGSNEQGAIAKQEIASAHGSIRQIKLADGSMVWLNEGSKIGYNDAFNDKVREVWLTGEAFFDVAKNKDKPFLIHANKVNVKVLGTAFNIKSYPGEKSVETSLVRGIVEVTLNDEPAKKYILRPNQKLVVPVTNDSLNETSSAHHPNASLVKYVALNKIADGASDSVIAEVSWVDRKLAFYEAPFRDLAVQLGRRYHVAFIFKDKRMEEQVFTGVFYEQTLSEVLHALSITLRTPFTYRIQDNTVYIY